MVMGQRRGQHRRRMVREHFSGRHRNLDRRNQRNPSSEVYGLDSGVTITAVLSWTGSGPAPTASDVTIGGNGPSGYSATSCGTPSGDAMTCMATYTPTASDTVGTYTETA